MYSVRETDSESSKFLTTSVGTQPGQIYFDKMKNVNYANVAEDAH